jgi:hypothetical protein
VIHEFQTERASRYLERVFDSFYRDPANSDHQRGYLAAALTFYREGLGKGIGDDRLKLLDRQVSMHEQDGGEAA